MSAIAAAAAPTAAAIAPRRPLGRRTLLSGCAAKQPLHVGRSGSGRGPLCFASGRPVHRPRPAPRRGQLAVAVSATWLVPTLPWTPHVGASGPAKGRHGRVHRTRPDRPSSVGRRCGGCAPASARSPRSPATWAFNQRARDAGLVRSIGAVGCPYAVDGSHRGHKA